MLRASVISTSFQQRRILKARIRSRTYPCMKMILQLFTDHQELEEFLCHVLAGLAKAQEEAPRSIQPTHQHG